MRVSREASVGLRYLLHELHDVKSPAPALVARVEQHATVASESICTNYATLNSVIGRHVALIKKRWLKKSPAARRELLLAAWPDMPEQHLSDSYLRAKQEQHNKGKRP
jgi:hypothetical protein